MPLADIYGSAGARLTAVITLFAGRQFPLDKNPLSDYTLIKIRKQILKGAEDAPKGSVHPIRLNLNSFAEGSEDAYE